MIKLVLIFFLFNLNACKNRTHGYIFYDQKLKLKDNFFQNKTKNNIISILGSPLIVDDLGNFYYFSSKYKSIYGLEFFQSTQGLVFSFDDNGVVKNTYNINVKKNDRNITKKPIYIKYN